MMVLPNMTAGITPAGEGEGGVVWNILGQTYKPLQHSASSFAFDTVFPDGTFVPPHIHANQDEFIYMLDGKFELFLAGETRFASTGDLIRLPMGLPHGIFNKSGAPVRALFWVAPSFGLYELFSRIHNVGDPGEVVRIAAEYDVEFLPPPG
jgi:quercetin dioxygenase-like cupin family protein